MTLHDEVTADQEVAQLRTALQSAKDRTAEVGWLKSQNSDLSDEIKELRATVEFYGSARRVPIEIPKWQIKSKVGKHAGLAIAQMTDWHLDEVVKPEEIFDLNAFNRDIAHLRIKRWVEKVVTLPRDYMAGVSIEGLILPATGDLFTGDIHAELRESNEAKLLASVLYWQEPVIAALEMLEGEYPSVAVYAVVGNHGRLSDKPIFKGRVQDNVEWLFWSVIRDRLKDRKSSVAVNVSPSMDLNVPIYGRNHLLTHGDQFKGGTGISGAFAPLSLGAHRKTRRQMVAQMPMETMVIGHLHQLINIPGVIMGGCLKGYDEFAFGHNFPPDPNGAAQAFWVSTPERAQTIWMPIYLQSRKDEGW
jgi:hypothetical protein